MMRRLVPLLIFVLLIPSSLLAGGWSRAGLFGADVRALVIDPRNPDLMFLGTSEGEVYVSSDGAKTWQNPRGGIPFPGYVVDNLNIDSRGRLWAACWGLWSGGVIAVSDDGGVTWSRRDAGLEQFSVRAFAIDPRNPEILIAGGLTGTYRSTDDGKTWTKLSEHVNVESLAIDPRLSDRIYVGTWRQAWRTDDGGKEWKHIEKGMVLDTDVFSINLDPRNPDNLWIATCGWVYNSADRGDTWVRFKDGFNNRRIHAVEYDPINKSCVYAGSVAGLYRTLDAGKSWQVISPEDLVINAIGIHPERPHRIVLGTEGDGIYVSEDRGKTFARSNHGLYNVRVATVLPDPDVRNRLYAAVMFGGASSGIYRSNDGGLNWDRLSNTKLPEVLTLIMQDHIDARFVAGTEKGFYWSRDGIEWTQSAPVDQPIRVEEILPYNATRLFAATGEGVFTSKDSGRHWYRLGDSEGRILDLALGRFREGRALYAIMPTGLKVFDGQVWHPVADSPSGGHSVAVRSGNTSDTVVIAGTAGIFAGRVDGEPRWKPTEAPAGTLASVYQSNDPGADVIVNLRDQNQLLISSVAEPKWRSITLPLQSKQLASVVADPFRPKRLYLGTVGQGLYVWDEGPVLPERSAGYLGGGTK